MFRSMPKPAEWRSSLRSASLLKVTIFDNGIGFNMEAVLRDPEKWDHFGIRAILERARLVGGEATIDSKKDVAHVSCFAIPLSTRRRFDMEKIKVLISDDHRVVREGLRPS